MRQSTVAKPVCILACLSIAGASFALNAAATSTFSDSKASVAPNKVNLEQQARSRKLFHQAMTQYQSGDYHTSRNLLRQALAENPGNADAQALLAKVTGEFGVANAATTSALGNRNVIALQARLVELHNQLGRARQLMDYAKGLQMRGSIDLELLLAKKLEMYNQARDCLDRANELIKWMPSNIEVESEMRECEELRNELDVTINRTLAEIDVHRKSRTNTEVQASRDNIVNIERQKIATMLEQAWILYYRGQFARARGISEDVLALDTLNTEAATLRKKARDAQYKFNQAEIERNLDFYSRNIWNEMDRISTPIREFIVFPDDWREKKGTRASISTHEGVERGAPQWKQNIQQSLAQPVTFDFQRFPLGEALKFIEQVTKIVLIRDPNVVESGVFDQEVSMRVVNMPASDALKWLLSNASLEYAIQDKAVFVFNPSDKKKSMVLEIYDIRDVTYVKPQFRGPLIESVLMANNNTTLGAEDVTIPIENISELIQQFVEPTSWTVEGATIEVHETTGKLFVMQTEDVHHQVSSFLTRLRERQVVQVGIQVRFIEVRENFLEEVGIHFTGLDAHYNPSTGVGIQQGLPHGPDSTAPYLNVDRNQRTFQGVPINLGGGGIPYIDPLNPDAQYELRFSPFHTTRPSGPYGMRDKLGTAYAMGETIPRARINPLESSTSFGNEVYGSGGYSGQGAFLQYRYVGSMAANAILHALAKDQLADQMTAPRLTVFNNQSAFVLLGQQNAFVSDYQVDRKSVV